MMKDNDFAPKPVSEFNNGNFWVIYGKNGTGKTHLIGTFPKLLVVCFEDQGLNTLKSIPGVDYISLPKDVTPVDIIKLCELYKDSPYETIAFDTFGTFQARVKDMIKTTLNKTTMTQQMWGDLGEYVIACIKAMKELSRNHIVIATFHEQTIECEGYQNEIPTRVSISTIGNQILPYLEGQANYVLHTFIYDYQDNKTLKHTFYHACHVGVNPYYWTKFQTDKQVPDIMFNPTYNELIQYKN